MMEVKNVKNNPPKINIHPPKQYRRHLLCFHIKMPKSAEKFFCEPCDFSCSKRSNYTTHLATRKHIGNVRKPNGNAVKCHDETDLQFGCEKCNKNYNNRSGLWKHNVKHHPEVEEEPVLCMELVPVDPMKQKNELMELVQELIQQNQEIRNMLEQQSTQIKELSERAPQQTMVVSNSNVVVNNHFNLNVFLNETCKDAINMSEFINNIEIQYSDLEELGRIGYVDGISKILVDKLQELDVYRRPIHCTDIKRETIYIKDENVWNKDTDDNARMMSIIKRMANKHMNKIPDWYRDHPESKVLDSRHFTQHMNIMRAAIGGPGGSTVKQSTINNNRVLKQVLKQVHIDKDKK